MILDNEVVLSWNKVFNDISDISIREVELIYNFSDKINLNDFCSSFEPLADQRNIFFSNICDYFSLVKVFNCNNKVVEVNPDLKVLILPTILYNTKLAFYISVIHISLINLI